MRDGKVRLYLAQRKQTIRAEMARLESALDRDRLELMQIEEAEAALEEE